MEALARRRLEAARDALRVASPQTTVTQVAADCGFFHFGRFAFHYRRAFGETPSATLARARQR
jgi:transcriptional regulator GlxA family with amidase domain